MSSNDSTSRKTNNKSSILLRDDYLNVFDGLPSLMWRSGTDAKFNYFNQAWLEFTGRTIDEEMGDGWRKGVHSDDIDRAVSVYLSAFQKQEKFEVEHRLRYHTDEYRWIRNIGQPIKDKDGRFAGFIGTCFDLTEQKEMDKVLRETNQTLEATNAALQQREEMFKGLFEYAPDAVVAVDQTGKIVLVNRQTEEVFGYSREELIGQPIERLMPDSYGAKHRKHLAGYMSDPHIRPMGLSLALFGKRKDGSSFPVDIMLGPLKTGTGILVMATIRDITERKRTEQAIFEREKLLTTAAQAAPIAFFRIDRQGIIQFSLGQSLTRRMYDVDPIGQSIYSLFQRVPEIIKGFEQALNGKTVTLVIEADDRIYETTYAPLDSGSGEIQGVVGVASDLTHHHQVERALYESEAHFRTIFNDTILSIFLLDTNGKMIETNAAMQTQLGYSTEDLAQINFIDLVHPDDISELEGLINDIYDEKSEYFQTEKRFVSKDNLILWFRLALSLFRGEDGATRYGIGIMENITAQKQAEAELAEVQRRLSDSAELERLHLAQDLHDGPLQDLQAMGLQLAWLDAVVDNDEVKPELKGLQDELSKVIQSIRSICGELRPPSLAPFGLQKAIQSHVEQFREKESQIDVHLDLMNDGKQLPERVRMALFRIYQQSMTNIARHARAENVWVNFSFDQDIISLRIQDDGIGFNITNRWIELVRQGHFGLVGSIERAKSIGGKMDIQSKPGSGTAIVVTIPRREEDQVSAIERYWEITAE